MRKVVCINLLESKDRYDRIKEVFSRQNLNVEFYHTVKYGFAEQMSALNKFNKGHEIGEFGCAMSHYTIIKTALLEGYDEVLIFEDDVLLIRNFNEHFAKAYNDLPQGWGCALLFSYKPHIREDDFLDNKYWNRAHNCWSCNAYLANKAFMQEYISRIDEKGLTIADVTTFEMQDDDNVYLSKEFLAIPQQGVISEIRGEVDYADCLSHINLDNYE